MTRFAGTPQALRACGMTTGGSPAKRSRVRPQRAEHLAHVAIHLLLHAVRQVAVRAAAEPAEEAEDRTFLHDECAAAAEDRLAVLLAEGELEVGAAPLERAPQRAADERLGEE